MQSPLLLFQSFAKHIHLSTEEETIIMSFLQSKKIKKKQFLLQEGDVNHSVKFVLSGLLRLYAIGKSGIEHVIQFAPAGWWITDMQSYLNQSPGSFFIDALEETEILEIRKEHMDELYVQIPSPDLAGRWAKYMLEAIDEVGIQEHARSQMREYFKQGASFMVNRY